MRYSLILLFALLVGCSGGVKTEAPAVMSAPPPPQSFPETATMSRSPVPEIIQDKVKQTKTIKTSSDPIIAQLFKASMAFVVPDSTNIMDDFKAQLLIDPSKDDVSKALTVNGSVTKSEIQISKVAIAKLTAPDFTVSAITPEKQALTNYQPTEWLWDLQPKTAGEHDIQLSITAVIKIDGDKSEHHLKTFEKTVTVKITPMQVFKAWFIKYWQWLVSTLLLPLAIWVYKEKIKKAS